MKLIITFVLSSFLLLSNDYVKVADKIYQEAKKDTLAWARLAEFCDFYGYRPNGSTELEEAIDYVLEKFKNAGLENAKKEPVEIDKWVRGYEECKMTYPVNMKIPILALGTSISTPKDGLEAEVLVVKDKEDLDRKGDQAKGKIVLFNRPFTNYGETVQYRINGANWASKYGAVASLIRSVSPHENSRAHTGISKYNDSVPRIPHAAISLETANMLQRLQDRGETPKVFLNIQCENVGKWQSNNVMAELVGSEKSDEIFVVGGHIDAWDVGQGAHDDGGPCFAVLEAVKILKKLNLTPKRTVRVCFWTAEEIGIYGGKQYAEDHKNENHWGAMEFDSGVFKPDAIGFSGDEEKMKKFAELADPALSIIDPELAVKEGGGGADISPLREYDVDQLSLRVDSNGEYWRYHHSETDTIEKIDSETYSDCIAALAIAIYIYADM